MGDLVSILIKQVHNEGTARCLHCGYEWQAVAPVGTEWFECPECHLIKGIYVNVCVPESYWECKCGSMFYCLSATHNLVCAKCGTVQKW